jgi:hypothetical protein
LRQDSLEDELEVGQKSTTHRRARPVAWCVDGLANQTATCTTV